jgi:hypothetical protein
MGMESQMTEIRPLGDLLPNNPKYRTCDCGEPLKRERVPPDECVLPGVKVVSRKWWKLARRGSGMAWWSGSGGEVKVDG